VNVVYEPTAAPAGPLQPYFCSAAIGCLQPIKFLLENLSSVGLVKSFSSKEMGVEVFQHKRIL
jgi:hypothetical protein